eukprot:CAMPEP_0175746498 /NCGR_PEP_ID=MMETSP0097-20121207/58617_1 /TAXON_ID=311494 /ORGANISM="Alexandrium monilatum, Strain CCMP3105" /LENGTH=372 /DNA_ID=CAMNT_0017054927 /DNA_START=430 /DNA_END=1544 /DNA_ORIENTATION=+
MTSPPMAGHEAAPVKLIQVRVRVPAREMRDVDALAPRPGVEDAPPGQGAQDAREPPEPLARDARAPRRVREDAHVQLHAHVQGRDEDGVGRADPGHARKGAQVLRQERTVQLQQAEELGRIQSPARGPQQDQEALLDRVAVPPALLEGALLQPLPRSLHETALILACLREDPGKVHHTMAADDSGQAPLGSRMVRPSRCGEEAGPVAVPCEGPADQVRLLQVLRQHGEVEAGHTQRLQSVWVLDCRRGACGKVCVCGLRVAANAAGTLRSAPPVQWVAKHLSPERVGIVRTPGLRHSAFETEAGQRGEPAGPGVPPQGIHGAVRHDGGREQHVVHPGEERGRAHRAVEGRRSVQDRHVELSDQARPGGIPVE